MAEVESRQVFLPPKQTRSLGHRYVLISLYKNPGKGKAENPLGIAVAIRKAHF